VLLYAGFCLWIKTKSKESKHELQNGILYLKGGFNRRIKRFSKATQYDLADFFEDEFKLRKWCMCL
jgi:16S rRNA (guanine527-N7)-methyltransferase